MSIELAAELVMAVRDYECREKQRWDEGVDFTASDAKSNERILLRVITNPKSNSGIVGVESIKNMVETVNGEDYDSGVLISERFSEAAIKEMMEEGIQMFSTRTMPSFEPEKLYLAIRDCIDDLCKIKCGQVPVKESDCTGKDTSGNYSCDVRLVSDNASFHFEKGWETLLRKDLTRLLTFRKSAHSTSR
jgi:hypothetical protein